MNVKHSDERDLFARYLVAMTYEGRNSVRNLKWVNEKFAKYIHGTSFESFSSYLDIESNPHENVELPLYIIEGLWMMVNVPRTLDRLSDDLVRKLASSKYTAGRHGCVCRKGSVLLYPDRNSDDSPTTRSESDPEKIYSL